MANLVMSSLAVPTAVAAGAGQRTYGYNECGVYVFGTFVQTLQIQVSPDGVEWFDEGSPFTAKGKLTFTVPAMFVRVNVTVHVSGQATVMLVGEDIE